MSTLRHAARIARKDLRVELRVRDVLGVVALLALLVIAVASFSLPTTGPDREGVAAGLLWIAFLFSILLGVGRALAAEHEDRCVDALVVSPVARESIFLGKLLSTLAVVGVAQALIVPLAVVLLGLQPAGGLPLLLATIGLGTVALVSVSTLFSTMAVNTRGREAVLPVFVVPLAIPVMIAAVQASEVALVGGGIAEASGWLGLLMGSAVLFVALGLLTFRHVLEE